MQLYLHNTLLYLHNTLFKYTTFACVTLPECCADLYMGIQHSCPNLLLMRKVHAKHLKPCPLYPPTPPGSAPGMTLLACTQLMGVTINYLAVT